MSTLVPGYELGRRAAAVVEGGARLEVIDVSAVPIPGPPGPVGPPGPTGATGPVGATGATGATGAAGAPQAGAMVWRGVWAAGVAYQPGDVVRDQGLVAVATAPSTGVRPSPVAGTVERWQMPDAPVFATASLTATLLSLGLRAPVASPGYLVAVRYWDPVGAPATLRYDLRVRINPGTINERELVVADRLPAVADGAWHRVEVGAPPLLLAGGVAEVALTVRPSADAVETILTYSYTKSTSAGTPGTGDFRHQSTALDAPRVHKTGQNGQNNAAFLATVGPGWTITCESVEWSVLSASDQGTYVQFGVAPAVGLPQAGVKSFVFRAPGAVAVSYVVLAGHWAGTTRVGWTDDPTTATPEVVSADAYGVDACVVDMIPAVGWDVFSAIAGAL